MPTSRSTAQVKHVPGGDAAHAANDVDTQAVRELSFAVSDFALAKATIATVQTVMIFVREGLGVYGGQRVDASAFETCLMATLLELAIGRNGIDDVKGSSSHLAQAAWDAAKVQAHAQLLRSFKEVCARFAIDIAPPWLATVSEKMQLTLAAQIVGRTPVDVPKARDPLLNAYGLAKHNMLRAQQRVAMLGAMGDLARGRSQRMRSTAGEEQYSTAMDHLWQRHNQHAMAMLATAAMLGGEAAVEAKEFAKDLYGTGKSVMTLASLDGEMPSQWFERDEQALRRRIAKA